MDSDNTQLKTLDPKQSVFTANGNEYTIEGGISFDRWKEYQKLQPQLALDITTEDIFLQIREAYSILNKPNPAILDAGVILANLMKGVATISDKRHPVALRMCALFINRKDEDRKGINEDLINSKIEDWRAEGFDIGSFFQLALYSIPGFTRILNLITPGTSEEIAPPTSEQEKEQSESEPSTHSTSI